LQFGFGMLLNDAGKLISGPKHGPHFVGVLKGPFLTNKLVLLQLLVVNVLHANGARVILSNLP
jgi:hypothetical protein